MASPRSRSAGHGNSHDCTIPLDALRRIVRALGISARTAEQSAGVTGAQLLVLEKLRDARAYSLNDLADRTFTHQSTVSVVVDRLVQRGLVARTRSADDARRVILALTPSGRTVLRRAPPPAQARLIEAIRVLPPSECRALGRGLMHIVEAMGLAEQPARLLFEETGPIRADGRVSSRRPTRRKAAPARGAQTAARRST